jgi:hypothetical protein
VEPAVKRVARFLGVQLAPREAPAPVSTKGD